MINIGTIKIKTWNIEAMTGYKPRTTFYEDFSIADHFGGPAIRDTYCRAFNAWQNNIEYMTELVMVLNWKIAEHYKKNYRLAEMYDELWRDADQWVYDHFDGDDLQYFIRTTDYGNLVFLLKKMLQIEKKTYKKYCNRFHIVIL